MGIISFPIGYILTLSVRSMIYFEGIWQLLFPLLIFLVFFAIGLAAFKRQPQAYYSLKAFVASFAGMFFILVLVFWPNSFLSLLVFFGPQHEASTSTSISVESSAENFTIYVPVLLDENKTVLKMYENPMITGSTTTSLIDTEHGKALKIDRTGLGNYVFNWNEVPGKDTDRFVKWIENVGLTQPGEDLDITKNGNGTTITVLGSITASGRNNLIIRLNENGELEFHGVTKNIEQEYGWHGLFFAKEENGNLNIYSGNNEISMNESHEKLKEDEQTSYEFFRQFTISMSNYSSPESFVDPSQYPQSSPRIYAWVYSDTEIEKIHFYYHLDPENRNDRIVLSIGTDGWIRLKKGWQLVNLSSGIMVWD